MPTALVTGASSGIGRETARRLLADGHTVYAAARRAERMRDLEERGATALRMDVTSDQDVTAAVRRVEEEHGGVDILVNNAGYAIYGAVEDSTVDDARRQFEVNLFGLARLTQLVLPHMRAQRRGRIVNVSSVGGRIYTPLGAWYHATKHALEGWSDSLRVEVAQFGIDVVVVQPGAIRTEFGDVMTAPMLERSGRGPYADLARTMARATEASYGERNSSPPSVVADTIARAVSARRPRTRYATGRHARTLLTARRWLGDRAFDRLIMRFVR